MVHGIAYRRRGTRDADFANPFRADCADVLVHFFHPDRFNRSDVRIGRHVILREIVVYDPAQALVVNGVFV